MVSSGSCPRSLSVRYTDIKIACTLAPLSLRLHKEFFRIMTAGRISRSAWLLSEGTPG